MSQSEENPLTNQEMKEIESAVPGRLTPTTFRLLNETKQKRIITLFRRPLPEGSRKLPEGVLKRIKRLRSLREKLTLNGSLEIKTPTTPSTPSPSAPAHRTRSKKSADKGENVVLPHPSAKTIGDGIAIKKSTLGVDTGYEGEDRTKKESIQRERRDIEI